MKFNSYLKNLLKLSFPIVLGQIGSVLMGITDMIMLGHIGKSEVAAAGVANQVYFLFMVFGLGTMAVVTPLVASSKSAGKERDCGEILRTGIELGFILSIFLTVVLILISENFYIFQQPEEVTIIAKKYLRIIAVSNIPLFLFVALKQFSDGLSLTKPSMYITIGAVIINIFFNWVFIYGHLTFPAMGAFGAGLATLLSRMLMALALVIYIFRNQLYKGFLPNLVSTFNTRPVIVKILKMGIPSGLQMFMEIAAFTSTSIFVGWLGTEYLAAHQIVLGISALTYTLATGLSVAGSIKIATAFGVGRKDEIIIWSKYTLLTIFIIMSMFGIFLYIFKESIIYLFINENNVVLMAMPILVIAAVFQVFDGLQVAGVSMLRSVEDVNIPTAVTIICYLCIGLPCSYIFAFNLDLGLTGIWLGMLVGILLSTIFLNVRFYILLNQKKNNTYDPILLKTLEVI
jgi:MATE family multidrug resistance protein